MKELKKTSFKDNLLQIITITLIVIFTGANVFGIIYTVSIFTNISTNTSSQAQPNSATLIPQFNTSLYNSILKDRQNRQLYTSSSTVPHYTYNEVFSPLAN